jgi:hypothetical protein
MIENEAFLSPIFASKPLRMVYTALVCNAVHQYCSSSQLRVQLALRVEGSHRRPALQMLPTAQR